MKHSRHRSRFPRTRFHGDSLSAPGRLEFSREISPVGRPVSERSGLRSSGPSGKRRIRLRRRRFN